MESTFSRFQKAIHVFLYSHTFNEVQNFFSSPFFFSKKKITEKRTTSPSESPVKKAPRVSVANLPPIVLSEGGQPGFETQDLLDESEIERTFDSIVESIQFPSKHAMSLPWDELAALIPQISVTKLNKCIFSQIAATTKLNNGTFLEDVSNACYFWRTDAVGTLGDRGIDIEWGGKLGQNFPGFCYTADHAKLCEILCRAGANVDVRYGDGNTLLHTKHLRSFIAEILIKYGADVDAKNDSKEVPLDRVIPYNVNMLRCLLKAGANPNTENRIQPLERLVLEIIRRNAFESLANLQTRQQMVATVKDFAEAGARFESQWIPRPHEFDFNNLVHHESAESIKRSVIREYVHGVGLHALDLFVVLTELNRTIVF
jgi:hypothetical protein